MTYTIHRCDKEEFGKVVEDLCKIQEKGHERLYIKKEGSAYVLSTKAKPNFFGRIIELLFYKSETEKIDVVAVFALKFFKMHSEYLVNNEKVLHQLRHCFAKRAICPKYDAFSTTMTECSYEAHRKASNVMTSPILRATSPVTTMTSPIFGTASLKCDVGVNTDNDLFIRDVDGIDEIDSTETLMEYKDRILNQAYAQALLIQKRVDTLADAVIFCKDGIAIKSYYAFLRKFDHFKNSSSVSPYKEDIDRYKEDSANQYVEYCFHLPEFSVDVVKQFLNFSLDPDEFEKEKLKDIELYRLADFLLAKDLIEACQKAVIPSLTVKESLDVLKNYKLREDDPIYDHCLQLVAESVATLSVEDFNSLPLNALQSLIKRDDLLIEDEISLIKKVLQWANHYLENKPDLSLVDVLYEGPEPLIGLMRFENLSADQYFELSENHHMFDLTMSNKLGRYFSGNSKEKIVKRLPRHKNIAIHNVTDKTVEGTWVVLDGKAFLQKVFTRGGFRDISLKSNQFHFIGHVYHFQFKYVTGSDVMLYLYCDKVLAPLIKVRLFDNRDYLDLRQLGTFSDCGQCKKEELMQRVDVNGVLRIKFQITKRG